MSILNEIIANKKKEISGSKRRNPLAVLEKNPLFRREVLSLSGYLRDPGKTGIIAEFKRKSPSKGIINYIHDPRNIISGYSMNGASAVSVLTDKKYFGGTIRDISDSRSSCNVPILRKDFIIDEYQVIEAKASGADAILLIAAALTEKRTLDLARFAYSHGLQVLLEIHKKEELGKLNDYITVAGVNNRDLDTFKVDINLSFELADIFPEGLVRISESGISSPETVKLLGKAGYSGYLIGETFMNGANPVKSFCDFISKLR